LNPPWLLKSLSLETLEQGVAFLCAVDPDLGRIKTELDSPPLWSRQPGFPTLVHIILEQQVSLASAEAAFVKLQAAVPIITPQTFLALSDDELKKIGFSKQKTSCCRGLAHAILQNEINLERLGSLDDHSARNALMQVKGIGPWTADIYLLMALLRPDIWPAGDLALVTSLQELKGIASRPRPDELDRITLPWRPWRAVATRLLWHYYLRPQ
jgi:DNA-3-methyladenine glycosylase II